ncbi:MAG TPA: MFS transporter, partial [Candidatus Polarisedimenticolaceae bacterium]|nr:MFS transporter [Candidatus Polarisedimenticolaceae bacterium]
MKVDCSERRLAPFFVVWSGQAVSLIGTQAVQFALVWWLTVRTGSATVLATATFVALAPQIVLGPFVGALVDRWNRKWIMLASDGAMAAASALLALSFLDGSATSGQVFALLFVRALGAVFHGTAMTAATSMMVPVTQLTRIQGLNQMLQ